MVPNATQTAALLAVLVLPLPGVAADGGYGLGVSLGGFDVADELVEVVEGGLELRLPPYGFGLLPPAHRLVPAVGATATSDGAFLLYGSVRYDWRLSPRWRISPFTGAGYFDEGDGKDLGGPVEFRSGLEVAVRFGGGAEVGLAFYHLSNADLYDDNPGSNSLVLTLATPLGGGRSPLVAPAPPPAAPE